MSVSAAELPAMSGAIGAGDGDAAVRAAARCAGSGRSRSSSCRRRWRFSRSATSSPARCSRPGASAAPTRIYVWGILAGSAVGLLASTLGRLYSSTYYALARHAHAAALSPCSRGADDACSATSARVLLPRPLGIAPRWGAAGLTASAGVAGWVEMLLLRRIAERAHRAARACRSAYVAKLWMSALAGAAVGWARQARAAVAPPASWRRSPCSVRTGWSILGATWRWECRRRAVLVRSNVRLKRERRTPSLNVGRRYGRQGAWLRPPGCVPEMNASSIAPVDPPATTRAVRLVHGQKDDVAGRVEVGRIVLVRPAVDVALHELHPHRQRGERALLRGRRATSACRRSRSRRRP